MPKCLKIYPNCQRTVTTFWPNLALDTVHLTKVYWTYSANNVRVCFTPLLQPTLQRDLKHKRRFPVKLNSPAMASLYEMLCNHSLQHLDSIMDELLTFIHTTVSYFTTYSSHLFWNVQFHNI